MRRRSVVRLAALGVALAGLGHGGHLLLEHLGAHAAHHAFHLLFGIGAIAVFALYLVVEIRRNGWPSFSWRLRPGGERERVR